MATSNYNVVLEQYTQRHFIKTFIKKYKSAWDRTLKDIIAVCERIDTMLLYKRADLIKTSASYKLVKLDFAVEGTRISPKSSGNRCILCIDENIRQVRILLVYSKADIAAREETSWWKKEVFERYDDINKIFNS
ncbi:MAG: hypothetical protein LBN20_03400 [Endomicrobium sp.]|jgi:hypothetical protein|nr:hypothetical protein [Endomicrobium sp.]